MDGGGYSSNCGRQRQNSWSHRDRRSAPAGDSAAAASAAAAAAEAAPPAGATAAPGLAASPSQPQVALLCLAASSATYHGGGSVDIRRLLGHIRLKSLMLPAAGISKQNLISTNLISAHFADESDPAAGSLGLAEAVAAPTAAASAASSAVSTTQQMLATAPCVPDIYPLETLHNSLTLRQLELFLHRFTRRRQRTPWNSRRDSFVRQEDA